MKARSKIHQKVTYAMKERRVGQSHGRTPPDVELERLGSSVPRSFGFRNRDIHLVHMAKGRKRSIEGLGIADNQNRKLIGF